MTTTPYPPPPAPAPAKPSVWKRPWFIPTATGVVGLFLGFALAGGDAESVEPSPAPTVTVTATVTAKPEPAPTVTVTVESTPEAEPEAEESAEVEETEPMTKGGLDAFSATYFCGSMAETALKTQFPGSKVKVHTIMGILAQKYREKTDDWFIKVEASVDRNRINVECIVSGSEDNPSLDDIKAY